MPLLQEKVQQRDEAAQLLAGQKDQNQPSIGEQIMQKADQAVRPQMPQMQPQMPQQGIAAAPSNLPQQMAGGGIVAFASGDIINEDEYMSPDDKEDAELAQLYGTGTDNDLIQAIAARGRRSDIHPSAGIQVQGRSYGMDPSMATHKYAGLGLKFAQDLGVSPKLAMHVMNKETGNLENPETAKSKAGALGVMQLMPKTAKELGVTNPMDPMQNIHAGVRYLSQLSNKYNGDERLAAMAYNWGPGNVDKWLRSGGDMAKVPKETRNYVANYAEGGEVPGFAGPTGSLITDPAGITRLSNYPIVEYAGDAASAAKNYPIVPYEGATTAAAETAESMSPFERLRAMKLADIKNSVKAGAVPTAVYEGGKYLTNASANTLRASPAMQEVYGNYGDPGGDLSIAASIMQNQDPTKKDLSSLGLEYYGKDNPAAAAAKKQAATTAATTNQNQPSSIADIVNSKFSDPNFYLNQQRGDQSSEPDIYQSILQDIKDRSAQAQKDKEQNKYMALLSAGLGMLGSKSPYALTGIGEGAQQGVAAYATLQKQQSDEAKDIAAERLGLYKYSTAADQAKALLGLKTGASGNKAIEAARDDLAQYEKTQLSQLKSKYPLGAMDPKYSAAEAAIYQSPRYKALEKLAYPSLSQEDNATAASGSRPPIGSFNTPK